MKIDEAIKILQSDKDLEYEGSGEVLEDAHGLGIEALKRRKYESERTSRWADMPLLGETKD